VLGTGPVAMAAVVAGGMVAATASLRIVVRPARGRTGRADHVGRTDRADHVGGASTVD